MTIQAQLRVFALKALLSADGNPLPDSTLRHTLRLAFPGVTLTEGDLGAIIRGLDRDGYITGTTEPLSSAVIWMLTPKGTITAQGLP